MDASIVVRLIDETRGGFNDIQRNLTGIGSTAGSLNRTMQGLASAATAFVTALGVREVLDFTNTIQSLDNRLKLVTTSTVELESTYQKLFEVAQKTRQPLDGTITLFSRMALAAENLGLSQNELVQITSNFNKALSIGGATTAEAQSAMIQFSQALTSGKVEMQELRPLLDSAPVLMRELGKALGLTAGEFRKFVSDGKITSDMLANALLVATASLDQQFGKTSVTVGQATNRLINSFQVMAREILNSSGATNFMVGAIELLEKNLIPVTIALGAFAAALAIGATIQLVTFAIGGLTVAVKGLSTALVFLSGTPLGRVVSLLGIAAGSLAVFATGSDKATKETGKLSDTTGELNKEQDKSINQYSELQKKLQDQVKAIKGSKDAYRDFIDELKQEIELSKLDSKEKNIQIQVNKALAAEAKKTGKEIRDISADRRRDIDAEVRALATQVEDEKKKTEDRKKAIDDLKRKQEEYDRFIESSRTKNLTGLALFYEQTRKAEQEYLAGSFKDQTQYEQYLAALKETYQNANKTKADEYRLSQLTAEQAYLNEVERITKEFNAGLIADEETKNILIEASRQKYAKNWDDMAKRFREEDLSSTQKYQKALMDLDKAQNAGLIKNQEQYNEIKRGLERSYIDDVTREYSNLYGLLNDKIVEWSGLSQKELNTYYEVFDLVFGIKPQELVKQLFASMIRDFLGFRNSATGDLNGIGGVITGLFSDGGTAPTSIGGFVSSTLAVFSDWGMKGWEIFSSFGSSIGTLFQGLGGNIMNIMGDAISWIGKNVGGGLSRIIDLAGDAISWLGRVTGFSGGGGGGGGSWWQTALSWGSTILSFFSDARMKKNLEYFGSYNGMNIYDFQYKAPYSNVFGNDMKRGVLAQEVIKKYPNAVNMEGNGMYSVDYSQLGIPNSMLKFARGGIVSNTTAFPTTAGMGVMGEAGPEAILPLTRTSTGDLGVRADTDSAKVVNVNFTVNTMDAKDFESMLLEKKQLITNIVSNAVREKGRSFA